MAGEPLLIVKKSFLEEERLQGLLAELGNRHQLDVFTARQRLWGSGLALFAHGAGSQLPAIAELLAEHGISHWLLTPTLPRLEPQKISALTVSAEAVTFACAKKEVVLSRGDSVLSVLADLSGAVAEKGVKKLLLHQAYRGTTAGAGFSDDALQQEILRSRPVLDLYLLTPAGAVREAVRIFPGRFNPEGLGARAGYSAAGNLRALMDVARSYAGEWHLRTDFGLVSLPGCQLKKDDEATAAERGNLASLTRFGWLMADLLAQTSQRRPAADAPLRQTAAAAVLPGLPAELTGAAETVSSEETAGPPELPQPVDFDGSDGGAAPWHDPKYLALVPVALFLLAMGMQQPALGAVVLRFGIDCGLLPALLSLLLAWRGFRALHLKRQVENTPTSKVRSLAMGLVEVHGRDVRRYALVSPMSHMPCVWYRISKYRLGENGTRSPLGSVGSGGLPFLLDDGTGRAVVTPQGARVCAQTRHEGSPSGGLLFATGSDESGEHWVEEVIPEGTRLYVLGFARPRRKAPASLKERVIERLRHLKASAESMRRFDRDGDGRISDGEWAAARRLVEQEVLDEGLSDDRDPRLNGKEAEIGRPPHRGLPFIIAEAASELHVSGRYGWRAALFLAGAVGLGVWAVLSWLEKLNLV
jgi:hypothetical protein